MVPDHSMTLDRWSVDHWSADQLGFLETVVLFHIVNRSGGRFFMDPCASPLF